MKRQCVKCGAKIGDKKRIWCSVCLDEVNKELTGQQNKPFQYYFRWNLRHKK